MNYRAMLFVVALLTLAAPMLLLPVVFSTPPLTADLSQQVTQLDQTVTAGVDSSTPADRGPDERVSTSATPPPITIAAAPPPITTGDPNAPLVLVYLAGHLRTFGLVAPRLKATLDRCDHRLITSSLPL